MPTRWNDEDRVGILPLIRETADSFVVLITAHFRISNLELVADLKSRTRQLSILFAIGLVAMVGYAFVMVGISLSIVAAVGRPLAFVLPGVVHLALAAVAAAVIGLRQRPASPMTSLINSVGESVANVAVAAMPEHTAHPPESLHGHV